ncbi:MAG: MFS transporter [Chloroflexi bacterium]|nr:MFS transporter [Chloroflexota bacterium]
MAQLAIKRPAAFDSLGNAGFRWLWLGRLASSATMEMGSVVQGWLAYELTGSALALGGVTAARSVARLVLSLYAGALADRFEKRQLLLLTRAGMVGCVLVLALLILTGLIQVWHLVAYSFLSGILSSFMMPAERAVMAELVGRKSLLNAVSLSSVGMGLMGIVGASAAGFMIASLGAGSVYLIMAGLYIWALFTLTRLPNSGIVSSGKTTVWEDLREGVRYMRTCPPMMPLIFIAGVRAVLGWSYRSLMPVYADQVLGFDARGLGILTAAPSVGSLISSMVLASMGRSRHKGQILLITGIIMGLGLIVFANIRPFAIVLLSLALVGAMRNATMITNQTLVQVNCDDNYRARAIAMYMAMMGLMPLGTIPSGALADFFGVPWVLNLQGILLVSIFALMWLRSGVKRLE